MKKGFNIKGLKAVTGVLTIITLVSSAVPLYAYDGIENNIINSPSVVLKDVIAEKINITQINLNNIINISQNINISPEININLGGNSSQIYKDEKGTKYIPISFLKENLDIDPSFEDKNLNINGELFAPYLIDDQVFVTEKDAKNIAKDSGDSILTINEESNEIKIEKESEDENYLGSNKRKIPKLQYKSRLNDNLKRKDKLIDILK